jgi:hypothetical protein
MAGNSAKSARGKMPKKLVKRPEKKIAPYGNGLGVAIWINEVESDGGVRLVRSVTINPRRYLDRDSGEWKDSGSFNVADIPALIAVLQKAVDFCVSTPISGPAAAGVAAENGDGGTGDEETPF